MKMKDDDSLTSRVMGKESPKFSLDTSKREKGSINFISYFPVGHPSMEVDTFFC